ncbi:TPA: type IV secretion system protein VirB10 [Vibrio parahaemolyticus]|nr:type IV secretion system protein VirB10 [Vibrio alginolyticus]ULF72083.1 type IV secretion system protein VirB10 [Vibrio alginolyticus]HCE2641731.1 type IV secretion system protein VirB10 [Vibrio parahaemolyticus]HCH4213736.1 type IV secretion system protein VirB10 [Vibrio parahaemolyticus]
MMAENLHNEVDETQDDVERGLPSVNKQNKPKGGVGQKIIVGLVGVVMVLALVAVNGGFSSESEPQQEGIKSNDEIGNRLGPAPTLPPPPPPPAPEKEAETKTPDIIQTGQIAPPPPQYVAVNNDRNQEPTPLERKQQSSLLAFGNVSRAPGGRQQGSAESIAQQYVSQQTGGGFIGGEEAERADGLDAEMKPTTLEGARAGLIADRNMFVTRGTFLDCALETAISSDVPGMTSCRLTRDVYSTSGKVLLLERGSRITGQYQGGLQRGKARIFVLWTRVETPNGVVVNLDSPGTDSLGRSGHSGYIDSHFWQRFGGAIMLSLIDDVGTYAANQASGSSSGNNQIQFGGTAETARDAAGIALENSINIPDTLLKHQGEHINVFVARDLDFRGVYELRAQ